MSSLPRFSGFSNCKPVKLDYRDVDLPDMGCSFRVWELDGLQVQKLEAGGVIVKGGKVLGLRLNATERLLLMALRTDDGAEELFDERSIKELMKYGGASIKILEEAANELRGVNVDKSTTGDEGEDGGDDAGNGESSDHRVMSSTSG